MSYVIWDLEQPCKLFQGYRNAQGYGQRRFSGTTVGAHRLAYCEHRGIELKDIAGQDVLHKCDNPPCIEGEHLFLGTRGDNNKDRAAKGRSAKQVPTRQALTEADVEYIRSVYTPYCKVNGASALASLFEVDRKVIHNARKGVGYCHT